MGEADKRYEAYKIPAGTPLQKNKPAFVPDAGNAISFGDQGFAEIEIESTVNRSHEPTPGPQAIQPITDEKRKIFTSMRDISRNNHSSYFINSKFYNKQVRYENSKIFYRQAVFMKDFEDDYIEAVPFSSYFPYYQLMGYEQLRTYFTWRTKVRNGKTENTSLSYAFIYIYELLNNIGVTGPQDGLCKLMSFWNTFKAYDATINRYLIKWIKDYHVYYELPKPFKEFLVENELQDHYPDVIAYEPDAPDYFKRLCGISKYNIKKSSFYSDETEALIADCFDFVIGKLKKVFENRGIVFNDLLFRLSKNKVIWSPFNGALFYPVLKQPDRCIVMSENEVYSCSQNKWLSGTVMTIESGRQLIGYILKQMESDLRKAENYKYKLTANPGAVSREVTQRFDAAGISLEGFITGAVSEFYAERTKTVVSVDITALNRIRLEALDTQEKLIVPEDGTHMPPPLINAPPLITDNAPALSGGWTGLQNVLSETELQALTHILQGGASIKQFADEKGIMPEVLADSINEKAVDYIGDSILEADEGMTIFEEYKEEVIKMVGFG